MDIWLFISLGLILFINSVYLLFSIDNKELKPRRMLTSQLFLNIMMLFIYFAITISAIIKSS